MIIEFGVRGGYEGCYNCEYEAQEGRGGERSDRITNTEAGTTPAVGSHGAGRLIHTMNGNKLLWDRKKAIDTLRAGVNMSVTDAETWKQRRALWL